MMIVKGVLLKVFGVWCKLMVRMEVVVVVKA